MSLNITALPSVSDCTLALGYARYCSRLKVQSTPTWYSRVLTGHLLSQASSHHLVYQRSRLFRFHICHVDAGSTTGIFVERVTLSGGSSSVRILVIMRTAISSLRKW